jgi:hypothetical protein
MKRRYRINIFDWTYSRNDGHNCIFVLSLFCTSWFLSLFSFCSIEKKKKWTFSSLIRLIVFLFTPYIKPIENLIDFFFLEMIPWRTTGVDIKYFRYLFLDTSGIIICLTIDIHTYIWSYLSVKDCINVCECLNLTYRQNKRFNSIHLSSIIYSIYVCLLKFNVCML